MIKDFFYVNKQSFINTIKQLKRNPGFIIGAALLMLTYSALSLVIYKTSLMNNKEIYVYIFSIIDYLLRAVLFSSIAGYLYNMVHLRNIDIGTVLREFIIYIPVFINIIFYIYIIGLLKMFLMSYLNNMLYNNFIIVTWIDKILSIIFITCLNPIIEIAYFKRESSYRILPQSFDFVKNNFVNWLIPTILFIAYNNFSIDNIYISSIVSAFIVPIVALYRANLYKILTESNRRKRKFEMGL